MEIAQNHTKSQRKQRQVARRRKSRIQSISLVILGIALAVIFAISLPSDSLASINPIKVGEPMSDIALTDLQGNQVKLSDYAGRPVLINAWSTWCPPCRAEMPLLQSFYEAHQAEGFTMLAINAGESQPTVSSFISRNGFSFPVLLDPNNAVLNQLGISSFPTSVLVGSDGVVKTIHVGMFTPESLEREIAAQMAP